MFKYQHKNCEILESFTRDRCCNADYDYDYDDADADADADIHRQSPADRTRNTSQSNQIESNQGQDEEEWKRGYLLSRQLLNQISNASPDLLELFYSSFSSSLKNDFQPKKEWNEKKTFLLLQRSNKNGGKMIFFRSFSNFGLWNFFAKIIET